MDNRNENTGTYSNKSFSYTYSASQQQEIKNIRQKYLPKDEDKMEQLRRLDRSVTTLGTAASLAAGIIGCLILGVGMCCCMVWGGGWFIPGIIIGMIGIAVLGAAYPLYNRITEKQREKLAPEILRLTDELMK